MGGEENDGILSMSSGKHVVLSRRKVSSFVVS